MTSDSAVAIHKKVSRLIDNANLHEAFSILKERLNALSFPELSDRLKNMEETYKYMIHYLVEGYADSGRDSMLADIVAQLRFINDSVLIYIPPLRDSSKSASHPFIPDLRHIKRLIPGQCLPLKPAAGTNI